jgi:hypothetical protein
MFIEYIERLRKEPPDVRRQAVQFLTVVIVFTILLLYVGVLVIRSIVSDEARDSSSSIAAPYEAKVRSE